MVAGRLLARLDRYKRVPVAGLALATRDAARSCVEARRPVACDRRRSAPVRRRRDRVMYPFTTVVIQNVVPPHQLGTATGTLISSACSVARSLLRHSGRSCSGARRSSPAALDNLAVPGASRSRFLDPFQSCSWRQPVHRAQPHRRHPHRGTAVAPAARSPSRPARQRRSRPHRRPASCQPRSRGHCHLAAAARWCD